ncbi:MAG: GC-type dockerin domain-anchored protein [Phycisphaerales bacterium]
MVRSLFSILMVSICSLPGTPAVADTTVFFNSSQVATPVSSGVTSETFSSNGYIFTCTRDKLFTGGTGMVIGRTVRVPWPVGIEAQAVTTPPPGVTDHKARITIRRTDGAVFDFISFSARLLANTFGAGGAIEIMPLVDGEDALNDPLFFDVSGSSGTTFSYNESPNPWGSTALLKGYDTYKVALYVDFAFTALRFDSPVTHCPADFNHSGELGIQDIFDYLAAFFAGGLDADFNGSGVVSVQDIFDYLAAYFAGCP